MDQRNHESGFWRIFWTYLKQPLFEEKKHIYINPFQFRKAYRMKLLERCWQLDFEIEKCRSKLEAGWHNPSSLPTP